MQYRFYTESCSDLNHPNIARKLVIGLCTNKVFARLFPFGIDSIFEPKRIQKSNPQWINNGLNNDEKPNQTKSTCDRKMTPNWVANPPSFCKCFQLHGADWHNA